MTNPDVKTFRTLPLVLALGLALAGCKSTVAPSAGGDCKPVAVNKGADGLSLTVSDKAVKQIGPEYFGFNLENTEFQLSLWDPAKQQVRPEVVSFLKDHFPGAAYRYSGRHHLQLSPLAQVGRRRGQAGTGAHQRLDGAAPHRVRGR